MNDAVRIGGAIFYSDLDYALIPIPVCDGLRRGQSDAKRRGRPLLRIRGEPQRQADPGLEVGGNVTRICREFSDPTNPAFQPQGVPDWKAFAYAMWRPLPRLTVRPNAEYVDQRWTVTTAAPLAYYRTG